MALCACCQAIPFHSLPVLHPHPDAGGTYGRKSTVCTFWHEVSPPESLGLPWHENFDSLKRSAQAGCPLCIITQDIVQIWKNNIVEEAATLKNSQRLWLSKRFGGSAGFTVLVPVHSNKAYVVASVSFFAEPMDAFSGSGKNLDLAVRWVDDCVRNHGPCRHDAGVAEVSQLPSRVIDVGIVHDDQIKLVETHGMRGKYACLSHCWGSATTFVTARDSYHERILGIPLTDLPNTFRDAVIITRRLGLRYLWIDCLCICQDDLADWTQESARMSEVYSGAQIVIAADHSKSSSGGCFHSRQLRRQLAVSVPGIGVVVAQQLSHRYESTFLSWSDNKHEPLSTRGWSLQERVLAQRVLHYGSEQMFFECSDGIVGEDGFAFPERLWDIRQLLKPDGSRDRPMTYEKWDHLITEHGRRKLTKTTDKLPAISGLAKHFATCLGARFVAVLWSDCLVPGLAWQGDAHPDTAPPEVYLAPSCSWMGYGGSASTPNLRWLERNAKAIAEVEDWHIALANAANLYAEILSGWVRIRAPITELLVSAKEESDIKWKNAGLISDQNPLFRTRYVGDEEGHSVFFDYPHALDGTRGLAHYQGLQMFVILLVQCHEAFHEKVGAWGLVVVTVTSSEGTSGLEECRTMKRVGYYFVSRTQTAHMMADENCWKKITLV